MGWVLVQSKSESDWGWPGEVHITMFTNYMNLYFSYCLNHPPALTFWYSQSNIRLKKLSNCGDKLFQPFRANKGNEMN
jgi:hypothetical protein